jgi:hypothetical protein
MYLRAREMLDEVKELTDRVECISTFKFSSFRRYAEFVGVPVPTEREIFGRHPDESNRNSPITSASALQQPITQL